MMQNLLRIVKREPPKHRQPTIQPDPLTPHERPSRRDGQNERSKARDSDDGNTGEQGAAEVEVFFLLGGGADEGDGAHHGNCVETGAGKDGRLHEHERGEDGGLTQVEAAPEGVFLNVTGVAVSLTFNSEVSNGELKTHLSGLVLKVPYIVPILAASPTPMTTQGFVVISLYDHPLRCKALAATPMMPTPRPVCIKVSFRNSRS